MLNFETVNMLLSISESGLLDDVFSQLLNSPAILPLLEKFPQFRPSVMKTCQQWQQAQRHQLLKHPLPIPLEQECLLLQDSQLMAPHSFFAYLPLLLQQLSDLNSSFLYQAKQLDITLTDKTSQSAFALFIQRWRRSLIVSLSLYQQQILEEERVKLQQELENKLSLNSTLLASLSDNDTAAGKLWDMNPHHLHTSPIPLIQQFSEFLQQQPELQQLANQLGRSQKNQLSTQQKAHQQVFTSLEQFPSEVPEEVKGIVQSADLPRLMPMELALLGIDEMEYEFYKKLLEKQLLTYCLQGDNWQETQHVCLASQQTHQVEPKGPFIVCVDTSGSMGGFNEKCGKSFCLALLRIALAEERECHVMLFSTEVIHYSFTTSDGLEHLIRFLEQTFRGGTDLSACLQHSLDLMDHTAWNHADMVVISDFIAQRLPESLIQRIQLKQNRQQNLFHAVALSRHGKPGILRIFDYVWRFDTGLGGRMLRRWQR